jgi:Dna[CI] antecedent, DciA
MATERTDEDMFLQRICRRRQRVRRATPLLADAVDTYIKRRIGQLRKNASVVDVWRELLPEELYEHSRIAGISGGVVRVEVDPGPYMHEFQLLSSELSGQLQRRCRSAGVRRIVLRPRKQPTVTVEEMI